MSRISPLPVHTRCYDRMVFLHAAAEAHDHYFSTERATLTDSPGIEIAVGDALDAAGLTLDAQNLPNDPSNWGVLSSSSNWQ